MTNTNTEQDDPTESDSSERSYPTETGAPSYAKLRSTVTPSAVISPGNDYELADNVAVDLVKYVRSNTIRNEQQFLLLAFAYASGLFEDTHDYISTVTIGTSSSGKSHLKDRADELFHHINVMDATTGSDKVLVYDDEWDDADLISMGELNQPPEEMIEFLKRAHGGDEEVVVRSTRGNPASGFHSETIHRRAKSYHFTYAQYDPDFELWNRLLKIPVHESESKNRAVGRMAFGHGDIDLGDGIEYGCRFDDGTERLQAHVLDMKRNAPDYAVIPDGSERFGWNAWDIIRPIFKHSRSESNRAYTMVRNLVKASALWNFHERKTTPYTAVVQDDTGRRSTEQTEALVVEPQDVANVLRCLEVLRATTHEIDPRKRAVVEAIKVKSDDDGTIDGLEPIIEFLEESDASAVNKSELENIIDDLEEDYLIVADGSEIQARNWDALGEPNVLENESTFEACVDPITGEPFVDGWRAYREDALTTAEDLLETDDITSAPMGTVDPDDAMLITDVVDGDDELTDWETELALVFRESVHGERLGNLGELPAEVFIGLVDPEDPDISNCETTDTLLDPDHEFWDRPDKPDSWVETETDARITIQEAVTRCSQLGVLRIDAIHERAVDGVPTEVTLAVGRDGNTTENE